MTIDNHFPGGDYPHFKPPTTAYNPNGTNCIVHTGNYIINRDGHIMRVTAGNDCWGDAPPFLREINEACLRAKYLGCDDECLEPANQIRLASDDEIASARGYIRQLTLLP